MLKERLNLSLSEEGARALAQIVARTGLSRTAAIEAVLIEAALRAPDRAPKFLGAILPEEPDREAGAIQVRTDRKAARLERKAELAQAVASALPGRTPEEILASAQAKIDQQRRSYCPTHRPKWCPDDCKHRVAE